MMQKYLDRLKQGGVKLTPQRQEILRVLFEGGYYSVEEILRKVRARYAGVGLDTVYRTLNLFKKMQLVNELYFYDGRRRFELNSPGDHHHHLVCLECGHAEKTPFCPADCLLKVRENNPGFQIAGHEFTVYGYCAGCRRC